MTKVEIDLTKFSVDDILLPLDGNKTDSITPNGTQNLILLPNFPLSPSCFVTPERPKIKRETDLSSAAIREAVILFEQHGYSCELRPLAAIHSPESNSNGSDSPILHPRRKSSGFPSPSVSLNKKFTGREVDSDVLSKKRYVCHHTVILTLIIF